MRLHAFGATVSERNHGRWRMTRAILGGLLGIAMIALAGFAQIAQPPSRPPRPVLSPDANRLPDKNDQMLMRQKNAKRRNFDVANAERRKELMQASVALETLAMALKAQVDKSEDLSQNEINKAETIEKLARIVEERMKLTVAAN